MATFKSTYLANLVLEAVLGAAAFPNIANVYAALMTAAPTAEGGGTELAYTDYARVAGASFAAAAGGVKATSQQINFPPAGAGATSAQVIGVAFYDAAVAGHLLYYTDLAEQYRKTYEQNDQPIIPAGALSVTEA